MHQAALAAAILQPVVKAAVQLHQLAEVRLRLTPPPIRAPLAHARLARRAQPAPQRLRAHGKLVVRGQMLACKRRPEIRITLGDPLQHLRPVLRAVAMVRRPPA